MPKTSLGAVGRAGPALLVLSSPMFRGTRWHQHCTLSVQPGTPSPSQPWAEVAEETVTGIWQGQGRGVWRGFALTPLKKQHFLQKENHAAYFYSNSLYECQTTSPSPPKGQVGEQSSTQVQNQSRTARYHVQVGQGKTIDRQDGGVKSQGYSAGCQPASWANRAVAAPEPCGRRKH